MLDIYLSLLFLQLTTKMQFYQQLLEFDLGRLYLVRVLITETSTFTTCSSYFLPQKNPQRPLFLLPPMRIHFPADVPQPSLCLVCLSVFQLPPLFGLTLQQGDLGLNIDSRAESPCVVEQFCFSALLPKAPHVTPPHVPPLLPSTHKWSCFQPNSSYSTSFSNHLFTERRFTRGLNHITG